jgi:mRNA interferase HicA
MNADQLLRDLRRRGIKITSKRGTGHVALFNPANGKTSVMPVHGGRKQLGTGLINKILKDLGLK